ncbi:MAG: hypothetical protein WDO73_17095 [Ignavibacteriota bacterium]
MIDTQCSTAREQAAAILKAWGSNNLAMLHRNLLSAAEEAIAPEADSGESERLEMLAAIALKMRMLLETDQLYSAAGYLPLLRHLAAPLPSQLEYAFSC